MSVSICWTWGQLCWIYKPFFLLGQVKCVLLVPLVLTPFPCNLSTSAAEFNSWNCPEYSYVIVKFKDNFYSFWLLDRKEQCAGSTDSAAFVHLTWTLFEWRFAIFSLDLCPCKWTLWNSPKRSAIWFAPRIKKDGLWETTCWSLVCKVGFIPCQHFQLGTWSPSLLIGSGVWGTWYYSFFVRESRIPGFICTSIGMQQFTLTRP